MSTAIEILARTPIVTDDGVVGPLGVANAATITEALRTAGYEIVKQTVPDRYAGSQGPAPKSGKGFVIGGAKKP
jgi:hypothetical protein